MIEIIERKAGIKFTQIGIPQPEDVIRATSRDSIKQLQQVNDDVLPLFNDAADELIALSDGNEKVALQKALAFMSGCHKEKLAARSLLNGQEGYITFQIETSNTFQGVGLVWGILRRYVPQNVSDQIKGMRTLEDMKGAVFDVEEKDAQSFEDIFTHAQENASRKLDFEIFKCKSLPELMDSDKKMGGGMGGMRGGRGGRGGGFGGGRGGGYQNGYGGGGGGGRDQSSRQPRGNQDASCFVGNLSYKCTERDIQSMFSSKGLRTQSVRILHDDSGRSKGSAFVDFSSSDDAKRACNLDGQRLGNADRNLRINPAARK